MIQRSLWQTDSKKTNIESESHYTFELNQTDGDQKYILKVTIPELIGRDINELNLSVEGEHLRLSIPELKLQVSEEMSLLWREIPSRERSLRFKIPARVDLEAVSASLNGDTLEVELPLTAPQSHKVKITESH
jgi:HSP20 family molecular chaperone IbpA